MNNDSRELIKNVFCDILERVAFLFGDPVEKCELEGGLQKYMCANIDFAGPESGHVALVVPAELCEEIAANVLGLEPDDELVQEGAGDALKELLNVTCGHLLTSLLGTTMVFDLSSPVTETLDEMAWKNMLAQPETVGVRVDESPVLLNFRMRN